MMLITIGFRAPKNLKNNPYVALTGNSFFFFVFCFGAGFLSK